MCGWRSCLGELKMLLTNQSHSTAGNLGFQTRHFTVRKSLYLHKITATPFERYSVPSLSEGNTTHCGTLEPGIDAYTQQC